MLILHVSVLEVGGVDLNFLENNRRYGYSQVSLEYLWTATRILDRNSNHREGEASKATGM
jgi:hypothetical protein